MILVFKVERAIEIKLRQSKGPFLVPPIEIEWQWMDLELIYSTTKSSAHGIFMGP